MTAGSGGMLIDEVLPEFDATIVEHIVVDAPPGAVYQAAREMDFLQVHSPMFDAAMFVRGLPARIGRRLRDRPTPLPQPGMRLADLFDRSADHDVLEGWLALGERPGQELVFGAIGKFWQPDIEWRSVTADAFQDYAEPDFAKLVVGFSIRDYGKGRTLLSYEARTAGTDTAARRKFLRYWRLVHRFVHFVMRAAVTTVKDLAEERPSPPPRTADPSMTPQSPEAELAVDTRIEQRKGNTKTNGFNWHELMCRDPDKSERFYRAITGVASQAIDVPDRDYRLLTIDGRSVAGMTGPAPDRDDWPSGGPEGHWVCYFQTEDVDEAAAQTKEHGGDVLVPPLDIPGTGRAAVLRDPDGATFGVFASVT